MASVASSRVRAPLTLVACAASVVLAVAACGSDTDTEAASDGATSSSEALEFFPPESDMAPTAPAAPSPCPTERPSTEGAAEWTLPGATGSVSVTGPTDTASPRVDVEAPFSVTATEVHTLQAGDGPVVADNATVLVCYMGVNGRDGTVFDSTYDQGAPIDFPLDGVIAGFQKAIAGQTVGSEVAVAMTSADGYAEGQPSAGIEQGDTLVFAIKILDAST